MSSLCTIIHVPTGMKVEFEKISLVEYQDSVSTKYNETPVFGRMDPITSYQGTVRKVTFALRKQNPSKGNISKLMAMQYPTYANSNNALSISQPPLIKITLGDLLTDQLCAMDGFAFTPLTGFTAADSPIVRFGGGKETVTIKNAEGKNVSVPNIEFKHATMRFNLTILHEHDLGFEVGQPLSGTPTDQKKAVKRWLGTPKFGPGPDNQFL
jgi:hypothetical protein